jgi:hypothetical protein
MSYVLLDPASSTGLEFPDFFTALQGAETRLLRGEVPAFHLRGAETLHRVYLREGALLSWDLLPVE